MSKCKISIECWPEFWNEVEEDNNPCRICPTGAAVAPARPAAIVRAPLDSVGVATGAVGEFKGVVGLCWRTLSRPVSALCDMITMLTMSTSAIAHRTMLLNRRRTYFHYDVHL